MSKEAEDTIPEDIMEEARSIVDRISFVMPDLEAVRQDIATALHSERKKWQEPSTFNRLREK